MFICQTPNSKVKNNYLFKLFQLVSNRQVKLLFIPQKCVTYHSCHCCYWQHLWEIVQPKTSKHSSTSLFCSYQNYNPIRNPADITSNIFIIILPQLHCYHSYQRHHYVWLELVLSCLLSSVLNFLYSIFNTAVKL